MRASWSQRLLLFPDPPIFEPIFKPIKVQRTLEQSVTEVRIVEAAVVLQPGLLIVDFIQSVVHDALEGPPGSVGGARRAAKGTPK